MKIKEGFVLRKVGDSYAAVPEKGVTEGFNGVIRLNGTAARIWEGIEKGLDKKELCDILLSEYPKAGRDRVLADVENVIAQLLAAGVAED